jgi:hypothetical protein
VLKIELLRFAAKIKIKYSFKLVKQLLGLKIFQKKYENPEAFLNTVEREANDLTKVDSPHISQKLNNILSGYKKKYDERAEPLFKALLHFKEYLESYGKYGNLLTETRFKSNLPNDKIQSYFSKLNVVNKSETKFLGCQIVSSEELQSFLYSNFRNFNPAISKVPIKANCSNAALIRFFYEFCQIESKIESISPSVFHKMLKDNFQNLENTELKTIKKEFARVRPVHFPFD